jgi:hypothetical protein
MPIRTGSVGAQSRSLATWGRNALLTVAGMLILASQGTQMAHSYTPPGGFVSTPETAVQIARAVAVPIYGEQQVARQSPLTATLVDDRWVVEGKLPPGELGGVLHVEIAKASGCILRVTHGR